MPENSSCSSASTCSRESCEGCPSKAKGGSGIAKEPMNKASNVKKVIGVEYVPEAIEDAKINASINNLNNTRFFAGDMKDVISESFIEQNGKPDVIILDPPRAGVHPDVVDVIVKVRPSKIVYVSCNPATQARDISIMKDLYQITKVQPVDMFPHTHHLENVVLLELKNG